MAQPPEGESRALRRRVAWLDAAAVVSRAVLADPDAELRRLVVTEARGAAGADTASLIEQTAQPSELTNVVSEGLGAEVYEDLTFVARDSALGRAIIAGEPLLVPEILPWATDHDDPPNPLRLGPAMILPVRDPQGRNAALVLSRTADREPYGADEHDLAAEFAEVVSLAFRRPRVDTPLPSPADLARHERAVRVLHDDLSQRLFAIGVGVQSVIELGADPEAARRLRGYVKDLDEMIELLRGTDADDPPPPTDPPLSHD